MFLWCVAATEEIGELVPIFAEPAKGVTSGDGNHCESGIANPSASGIDPIRFPLPVYGCVNFDPHRDDTDVIRPVRHL